TNVYTKLRDALEGVMQKTTQEGKRPVIVLQIQPGTNQYGPVSDLAKFLPGPPLNGATTVAYIPETIKGHTVLLALACEEIIMHEDAQIGDAGADEQSLAPD